MLKLKGLVLIALCLALLVSSASAQSTVNADLAKKIEQNTPESLPQSPVAEKLKTDAQDNNLKGKVKSVIEYTEEDKKSGRKPDSEDYYNEAGNLVKSVFYDEGYPISVTAWGYIDGNRVSTSKNIKYEKNERPPSDRISISVSAEDNAINPNAPRDSRYKMRYTYKYNPQGQLTERWLYQNNGEVWVHNVYNYKGDQREYTSYDQNGSESSQEFEIFDKNGNVTERHWLDEDGKISGREINAYEFDKQGNWIVKKTFEPKRVKGKAIMKLLWTSYRTINYY